MKEHTCAHLGLTLIREEVFRTLQYLNQGIRTVVGPFDHQNIGPFASHTAPFDVYRVSTQADAWEVGIVGEPPHYVMIMFPLTRLLIFSSHAGYDPTVVHLSMEACRVEN